MTTQRLSPEASLATTRPLLRRPRVKTLAAGLLAGRPLEQEEQACPS